MAKIDGRSSDGRFLRRVRLELSQHVGGKPSATQHALIDRIAWLRLRIAAMDSRTASAKQMTELDSRTYLAWVRNVSTTLIQPGLEFRLGWSGRLCGIELSEAAGFLV